MHSTLLKLLFSAKLLYICREKELAKVVIRKEDVDLIVCMLFHMSFFLCFRVNFDTCINHKWIPRKIIFLWELFIFPFKKKNEKKKKSINKWHKENSFFTDPMVFATRGGLGFHYLKELTEFGFLWNWPSWATSGQM